MSWLLDTNTCSCAIRGELGVRTALDARPMARVHVCSITVAEAWAGCLRSPHHGRLLAAWSAFLEPFADRILPFDDRAAREYGAIRAELETRGSMIGDRDCMIAAIARYHGLSLVTRNVSELGRVRGVKTVDWCAPRRTR